MGQNARCSGMSIQESSITNNFGKLQLMNLKLLRIGFVSLKIVVLAHGRLLTLFLKLVWQIGIFQKLSLISDGLKTRVIEKFGFLSVTEVAKRWVHEILFC